MSQTRDRSKKFLIISEGNVTRFPFRYFDYKSMAEHLFDLELVEGVDTSVDCLTMSYLNYTDFIAFDNEKLTCSFGNFANSVETNKTFNLNNNTDIYIHSKSQKVEKYAKIILTSTYQYLVEWEVYDSVDIDINMCNGICQIKGYKGGFQLEFVSISRFINHMTYFKCSHWWKIYFKKILYKICSPV